MTTQTIMTDTVRVLLCEVGDTKYALDMKCVNSVLREEHIYWNTDGNLPDGWIHTKAEQFPVYSLAGRLGFAVNKSETLQRVLVLTTAQGNWGLLVDNVSQVTQINAEQIAQMPSVIKNAGTYFDGLVRQEENFVLLLSPERLHPEAQLISDYSQHTETLEKKASLPSNEEKISGRGRLLLFSLIEGTHSNERSVFFGLSVTQVLEVLNSLPLIPVPKSPAFVRGLVNWHNRPVPVIDLAARFGLPSLSDESATRLLICRDIDKENLLGFQIQPSVRMLSLPVPHSLSHRELPINKSLCKAVVELRNETLIIPDAQQIFSMHIHNPHVAQ